jgi:hypothetical protein
MDALGNPIRQLAVAHHKQSEIRHPTQQQQQRRGNKGEFHRGDAASIAGPRGTGPVH